MSPADTIVAPASGAGIAAIAVIRVSGPKTRAVLDALCGGAPPPRHASLRAIGLANAAPIDRGLVLMFEGPSSFTGEDMAELHVHGGRAVIGAVIDAALALPGTRLAEPGEFARRAFENGKLDLTEAEGLADLINAETEAQRRQALAQAEGSLRALYEGWRAELVRAQGLVEAGLDFADEGDVVAGVVAKADPIVAQLGAAIARHLSDRSGMRLRDGFRVVIAGAPNAGKSSLLNALAKREAAIVSEEAGTTRDIIEVHLDLGGVPVMLIDTAGLRAAEGKVEAEGIRRALARAGDADLVLWIVDATAPQWDAPRALAPREAGEGGAARLVTVLNKIDLAPREGTDRAACRVSAMTGEGLGQLVDMLAERAALGAGAGAGAPLLTRTRHRIELEAALAALERYGDRGLAPELKAEELRLAAHHLGRLTGRIDVEEVLGAIFAEFCIGK
ncbi:MAG: tRNA uridine-5-carboxymethylaminomethyl(34) synthesis GTPase MnmE [Methyloceanibacter sp.]